MPRINRFLHILFVIGFSLGYGKTAVKLLRENYAHKHMRKGHLGKTEPYVGKRFYFFVKTEGAAYYKCDFAYSAD